MAVAIEIEQNDVDDSDSGKIAIAENEPKMSQSELAGSSTQDLRDILPKSEPIQFRPKRNDPPIVAKIAKIRHSNK